MSKNILIIGAGPGRLATAIQLAAAGLEVKILERLPIIVDLELGGTHRRHRNAAGEQLVVCLGAGDASASECGLEQRLGAVSRGGPSAARETGHHRYRKAHPVRSGRASGGLGEQGGCLLRGNL